MLLIVAICRCGCVPVGLELLKSPADHPLIPSASLLSFLPPSGHYEVKQGHLHRLGYFFPQDFGIEELTQEEKAAIS